MDLLQYDEPILDPIGRAANGKLIKHLALGQNPKSLRGTENAGTFHARNGEYYVPRRLFLFALQRFGRPALPHSRAARCQRVKKVWKKEDPGGICSVGFELGLVLRD